MGERWMISRKPLFWKIRKQETLRSISAIMKADLRFLEPGPVFSLAEHVKTGYQLKIYNGFLEEPPVKGKENTCWEYTDYQIPLKKGDRVSILQETPEGTMVRKRGVTGWYYGKFQIQNETDRRTVSENQT